MSNNMTSLNETFREINTLSEKLGLRPYVSAEDFTQVEVLLAPEDSPVFNEYCDALCDSVKEACSLTGGSSSLSAEDVRSYLLTLLHIRVKHVVGAHSDLNWRDTVYIPAFFSIILENVGRACDDGLGVTLIPKFVYDKPLSMDKLMKISNVFRALQNIGLVCASQMPRDKRGSWDFMAMQMAAEVVKRHDDKAHPVYAFLASILAMKGLESTLLARVTYGSTRKFVTMVRQFGHV